MPYFDRFDICEAYWQYASDYNIGGYATGRKREDVYAKSNGDIFSRLARQHFVLSPLFQGYESLTDNGRDIYDALEARKAGVPA